MAVAAVRLCWTTTVALEEFAPESRVNTYEARKPSPRIYGPHKHKLVAKSGGIGHHHVAVRPPDGTPQPSQSRQPEQSLLSPVETVCFPRINSSSTQCGGTVVMQVLDVASGLQDRSNSRRCFGPPYRGLSRTPAVLLVQSS